MSARGAGNHSFASGVTSVCSMTALEMEVWVLSGTAGMAHRMLERLFLNHFVHYCPLSLICSFSFRIDSLVFSFVLELSWFLILPVPTKA